MVTDPKSVDDRKTPLAAFVALMLVLPGLLAGGLAAVIYEALITAGWNESGDWNPSLESFARLVWIDLMPEIIRGAVAIAVPLALTFVAFKRADRAVISYLVFATFVIVAVVLTAPDWYRLGALTLGFLLGALPVRKLPAISAELTGHTHQPRRLHRER